MLPDLNPRNLKLLFAGLWLLLHGAATAQTKNRRHLTLDDGLPSNNVYSSYSDHLGYLWLATETGLVRYNGYSFDNYTTTDGLPSSEVFAVNEDSRQRLWVSTLSNSLGYIRNNRYHRVHVREKLLTQDLAITRITEGNAGVWVLAIRHGDKQRHLRLFCELSDTLLYTGLHFDYAFFAGRKMVGVSQVLLTETRNIQHTRRYSAKGIEEGGVTAFPIAWGNAAFTNGPYWMAYRINNGDSSLLYNNVDRLYEHWKQMVFRDERGVDPISFCHPGRKDPYTTCICERNVYRLDTQLRLVQRYSVAELTGRRDMPGRMIADVSDDSLWGLCVSTRTDGVYFNYGEGTPFRSIDSADLSESILIGYSGDSVSWWWNDAGHLMLSIDEHGNIHHLKLPRSQYIVQRTTLCDGQSFLLSKKNTYVEREGKWEPLVQRTPDNLPTAPRNTYFRKSFFLSGHELYLAGLGLYHATLRNDTLCVDHVLHDGRYYGMEYDTAHAGLLLYNNNEALFYSPGYNRSFLFSDTLLRSYGIRNIEQICPHAATGTIFFNDHAHLYAADLLKGSVQRLNTGYNLEGAKLGIRGNRLFLAGSFGVMTCRITGPGQIGQPLLYRNTWNRFYRKVKDIAVLKNALVLGTDKQPCLVQLPPEDIRDSTPHTATPYRLVVSYRDTLYGLPLSGPLNITADGGPLLLDLINPYGVGRPVYRYALDNGEWQPLAGNEINLPPLEAGRHYRLSLQVKDDAWESGTIGFDLYRVPLWWQRPGWKATFWAAGIIGAALLLLGVVVLTRYFVIRAARKKAFLTSLELRTIYAQINPHFIFNTLNTALFFIKRRKNDEAFAHVSKFSQLLRAYLSSSRKRYISIEEEIVNLRNYIELQRTRFQEVFSYEIVTDNPETMHAHIPSMLLQPFVENAINHGLVPKEKEGHLVIGFRKEENGRIVCTVDDNGIGRERSKELKERALSRESFGNRLIQELVTIFNKYDKIGIEIGYLDKPLPETGTCVSIIINYPPGDQPGEGGRVEHHSAEL